MLGEMLGEETGKITGTRVLPSEGGAPKLESSFQATGRLYGVEETDLGRLLRTIPPEDKAKFDKLAKVL